MTVRHRQRKGAKGSSFLYARGKAFSKPQTFPPKPPEADGTWANNPSRPASFLRQFSPQHSPVARLFRGKKGLFCPQRPPYPPPKDARTPRFAPAPPGFCPARPGKAPARVRKGPGFSPGTPARTQPRMPGSARGCGFLPRLRPPVRRPPPETPPVRRPPPRPLPPPAAEGQPARPAKAQPLGKATPTAVVGFPASPWRSVRPQGGIRSLGMTGKRPPPPLA